MQKDKTCRNFHAKEWMDWCFFLNSLGLNPVLFLKNLEKYKASSKPTLYEISEICISDSISINFAFSRRKSFIYSIGEVSAYFLKYRLSVETDIENLLVKLERVILSK